MKVKVIQDAKLFNRIVRRDLKDGIVVEDNLPTKAVKICGECYYEKRGCSRKSGVLCLSDERAFRDSIIYTRKK